MGIVKRDLLRDSTNSRHYEGDIDRFPSGDFNASK